jgi:hypothetical protein
MNFKNLTLVLTFLAPLTLIGQIPVPKNKAVVLYDSLVTYFFGGEYDSLNSIKILFYYDEAWKKIKREQTYFWNQDNNYYDNAERKEYEYDDRGNTILSVVYSWNYFINDWSGSSKEEHFFSDTLNSRTIYGSWNEQRKDFDGVIKIDWYSGHDGINMGTRVSLWDTISQRWYFQSRYENGYNNLGKKTTVTGFLYDTLTQIWNINTKGEWLYNQQGKDSLNINYTHNQEDNVWNYSSKFEYLYSDTSRLTNIYNRDIQADQWILSSKYEDVWDKRGNLILNRNFNWNSLTSSWVGGYQHTYSFDDLDRMTQMIQSKWDGNQSDWLGEYKETHEFDNAGHRIQTNRYWWQYDWELTSSTDSIYDSNGNLILSSFEGSYNDHMFEYFYDDNNILNSYKSYIGTSDNRELWTKGFYYWTRVITGLNSEADNNIKVFPNPASTVFKITGLNEQSEVQIIDLQGTIWLQRNVANETEISIDWLNPGIYLLNIKTPKGNIIRKIIKN